MFETTSQYMSIYPQAHPAVFSRPIRQLLPPMNPSFEQAPGMLHRGSGFTWFFRFTAIRGEGSVAICNHGHGLTNQDYYG